VLLELEQLGSVEQVMMDEGKENSPEVKNHKVK
jgi:hypothetical protein